MTPRFLDRILATSVQRALFAAGCLLLLSWLGMRALPSIPNSGSFSTWLHRVFAPTVNAWISQLAGWSDEPMWFDAIAIPPFRHWRRSFWP